MPLGIRSKLVIQSIHPKNEKGANFVQSKNSDDWRKQPEQAVTNTTNHANAGTETVNTDWIPSSGLFVDSTSLKDKNNAAYVEAHSANSGWIAFDDFSPVFQSPQQSASMNVSSTFNRQEKQENQPTTSITADDFDQIFGIAQPIKQTGKYSSHPTNSQAPSIKNLTDYSLVSTDSHPISSFVVQNSDMLAPTKNEVFVSQASKKQTQTTTIMPTIKPVYNDFYHSNNSLKLAPHSQNQIPMEPKSVSNDSGFIKPSTSYSTHTSQPPEYNSFGQFATPAFPTQTTSTISTGGLESTASFSTHTPSQPPEYNSFGQFSTPAFPAQTASTNSTSGIGSFTFPATSHTSNYGSQLSSTQSMSLQAPSLPFDSQPQYISRAPSQGFASSSGWESIMTSTFDASHSSYSSANTIQASPTQTQFFQPHFQENSQLDYIYPTQNQRNLSHTVNQNHSSSPFDDFA